MGDTEEAPASQGLVDRTSKPGDDVKDDDAYDAYNLKVEVNRARAASRLITTEPVMLLFSISLGIILNVRMQYLRERLADDLYNVTLVGANSTCGMQEADSIADDIQRRSALWLLWMNIIAGVPDIFSNFFLGSLSDKFGRKFALKVALTGGVLWSLTCALTVQLHLSVYCFLLADFIYGSTGGKGVINIACYSYIADVTPHNKRVVRFAVLGFTTVIGIGVTQIVMGVILTYIGFLVPFWIATACIAACLAYVWAPGLIIETVNKKESKGQGLKWLFYGTKRLFSEKVGRRNWQLVLLITVQVFMSLATGRSMVIALFESLTAPVCWGYIQIGVYVALNLFVQGSFMLIGAKILPKYMDDKWLFQICLLSVTIELIFMGLSTNGPGYFLYIAIGVGIFSSAWMIVLNALLSKLVTADEQGLTLAFSSIVDNIMEIITPLAMQGIYTKTLATFAPTAHMVMVACAVPAMSLVGALQVGYNRGFFYNAEHTKQLEKEVEAHTKL